MHKKPLVLLLIFLLGCTAALADVRLPRLIGDGMVLQRNTRVNIWGWAGAGERVTVQFGRSIRRTVADRRGNWKVRLPRMAAGGPFQMTVSAGNSITIENILVGDVWICSGQSNMEISMERVRPLYEADIAQSENASIRYFEIPKKYDFNRPNTDISGGHWQSAQPDSILKFSAVAYFFALELYNRYRIPIGLINTSMGGSPAQAWISEEALKAFPEYYEEAQRFKDSALIRSIEAADMARIGGWYRELRYRDAGYNSRTPPWYAVDLDTTDWMRMQVPGYWANAEIGAVNGVVWFRKSIEVPASMTGQAAQLTLGRIVDADSVYVNGVFVGATAYQYPPRRYTVPAGVLKAGENLIAVRVINSAGKGGFVLDKPYELVAAGQKIDLKGAWQYRLGAVMPPLESQTFIRWKALGLYNAMVAPLLNYRMKGVIWYQGEANTGKPEAYHALLSALIADWRQQWRQGDFPFLFVQLANYLEAKAQPAESDWALLREAQLKTLAVRNTGMAVAIDLGEWNDIHPLNKKDVGRRLALAARRWAYGERHVVYSGPVFQSMKTDGNKAILSFAPVGGGLVAKGGAELKGFALAGEGQRFVWAKAKIEHNKVIVWSDAVRHPVAVRYAWADNPEGANLYNAAGLPASPFRTDDRAK